MLTNHSPFVALFTALFVIAYASLSVAQEGDSTDNESLEQQTEQASGMTQAEMAIIVGEIAGDYQGTPNNIQFEYNGAQMMLVSDPRANRMRLIAPILPANDMTEEQLAATMIANFHLALDARYAIGSGVLYAAFIHPLKELTREQLESAVRQVASLRGTFGTGYTSGELSFGVREPGQQI